MSGMSAIQSDTDAETLARAFHDAYERMAPIYGYQTRPDTRAFDPETPNGRLMVAVCTEILSNPVQRPGTRHDEEMR